MKIETATSIDKAYLAGVVEGHASMSLARSVNKKTGRVYHRPEFCICTSDIEIQDWLLEYCLGAIRISTKALNARRSNFYWYSSMPNIKIILQSISPFLKGKRREAENLIGYLNTVAPSCSKKGNSGFQLLSDETMACREEFYKKQRKFKSDRIEKRRSTAVGLI